MRGESVALFARREFRLLYFFHIVFHALALRVGMGQVEHVEPHAVDAREGDELVFVAHL
ncbi:hypothetical protein D3C76_1820940 [compost metagenome]